VIDISVPLREGMAAWPGDPPFSLEAAARLDRGDGFALSLLRLSAHAGSHLDFPAHLLPGGRGAEAFPPEAFLLPAVVVFHGGGREVPPRSLDSLRPRRGEAVLFRTGNSAGGLLHGRAPLSSAAFLAADTARLCAEGGAPLVAIDGLSVDPVEDPSLPAHRILLSAGIPILEGVDLSRALPGRYTLACFPLALHGCEAAPVRAVLYGE
jgi:arylformamidase